MTSFARVVSTWLKEPTTVEPPLTTTKEQPHAIKRPRTQVWIETTM